MNHENNSCKSIQEDLVLLIDGELTEERKAQVLAHVKECETCALVLQDLKKLQGKMQLWPAANPDEGWERRAEEQVRKQARDLSQVGQGKPASAPGGKSKPKPPAKVIFLRPWFLSAAAASLLLVVSVFGLTLRNGGSPMLKSSPSALPGDEDRAEEVQHAMYGHKNMKCFGNCSGGGVGPSAGYYGGSSSSSYSHGGVVFKSPKRKLAASPSASSYGSHTAYRANYQYADPKVQSAPKNGWYQSNYSAGEGERERVEKLIREGVVVDGSKIKLGSFAKSYHQKFPVPSKTALALYADVDHGKVMASGGDVFLQVGIQAASREMSRRPPLNLALVIDHSGSMSSDGKMDSARDAALKFVDSLRPDDRLVLLAYDDDVISPCSDAHPSDCSRAEIKDFIMRLRPDGSTNIYGALDRAYRLVASGAKAGMINTVILLSDGMPTAGNTDQGDIVGLSRVAAENGISTSSVGMGLDYNDRLMMQLASQGQGHYHFVKDASSMTAILKDEFDSLNRVVARALRLKIKLADNVVLKRVLGSRALDQQETAQVRSDEQKLDQKLYRELGIKKNRQKDDQEGIKMLIPYFFSGDTHVVMLHLYVPSGTRTERIAEVTLKYKDLLHEKNGMEEKEVLVGRANDLDEMVSSINRKVKKNLLGFRAGETMMSVAAMIARGQELKGAQMVAQQAELFRQAGQKWSDEELVRDAKLLDQYRSTILRLQDPNMTAKTDLRSYLSKTMSHSAYTLFR